MSDFSDYMEDLIVDMVVNQSNITAPTNIYLALFTAVTGLESNSPTGEVSGSGYARTEITTQFPASSGGTSDNDSNIDVGPASGGNWGDISHVAIVDHDTNTTWGTNVNVLMWKALGASVTINDGDTFRIGAGDLDVTVA